MPGKSRRRKGKYSLQKQKKKGRPSRPATVAQQPAVAQSHQLASSPSAPAPSTSVPTPMAKMDSARHQYIATELQTIGILAAIMLIILAVLAFVLS